MRKISDDISAWWWFGLPLVSLMGYVFSLMLKYHLRIWPDSFIGISGELGLLENAQVLVLVVAIAIGVRLLWMRTYYTSRWMGVWIGLLVVGCIYILGEEISWGQHYFGWATPEWIKEINYQGETNLHNIHSKWLIFRPRALMEFAIIFSGIVRPMWIEYGSAKKWPAVFRDSWLWPTRACFAASIFVLVFSSIRKIEVAWHMELMIFAGIDYSELREYFIYVFVLLYLWSFAMRLSQVRGVQIPNKNSFVRLLDESKKAVAGVS